MDFLRSSLITKRELQDMKLLIFWVYFLFFCVEFYQMRLSAHLENILMSVAYLIGLPILGYSLDIGKEHVNLVDERLQELIYSGQLDDKELDRYFCTANIKTLIHSLLLILFIHRRSAAGVLPVSLAFFFFLFFQSIHRQKFLD